MNFFNRLSSTAISRRLLACSPRLVGAGHAFHPCARVFKHVVDHQPDLAAHELAQLDLARRVRKALFDSSELVREKVQLHQVVERQEACPQAIVDIVIVIGDVVGNRRHLRFERWPLAKF